MGIEGEGMIELKPCPFCGCQDLTTKNSPFGSAILCKECEARGPSIFKSWEHKDDNNKVAELKWNSRYLDN